MADTVLFDGYQLTKATPEDVKKIKAFAQAMNIEVWFSVSPALTDVAFDEYGVPETMKPYLDLIDVLLGLKYNEEKSKVIMTVVQDHHKSPSHFTGVTLDPRTMLITE